MKKIMTFYIEPDNDGDWTHLFGKGDVWNFKSYFPDLYVSKEHIRVMNKKDYRKSKDKKEFFKGFIKVKMTIEELSHKEKI